MLKINRNFKKIFWTIFASLSVLVLVFCLVQKKPKEFSRSRIALIDKVGENYIFRGSNPAVTKNGKKAFAYDELTYYFKDALRQSGKRLDDYYLVDISLLDLDEYYTIRREKDFFAEHPNDGAIINVSTISPSLLLERSADSNIFTKYLTDTYGIWLTKQLNKIHEIATQQTDKPIIIYIHCNGGRDRTGLMAAGYRMLFNDANLSQAISQNIADAGRNSEHLYGKAINSYCIYVKQNYNKPDDYCAGAKK